eukprot:TRINITY_DN19854_c0_g1_i1.p1 TRINITY_DN19854_c0_g1~~TRINITY_DN19854_c0_g1_i1.p1  ORF type:complete len:145 (-),score=30.43 TRINITY_DN19854_c0_g1_i1:501-935(-)
MVLAEDRTETVRNEISAVLKEEREEEEGQRARAARIKREGSVASSSATSHQNHRGDGGGHSNHTSVKQEEDDGPKKVDDDNEMAMLSNMIDTRNAPPTRLPTNPEDLYAHALATASASMTFARVLESTQSTSSLKSSSAGNRRR